MLGMLRFSCIRYTNTHRLIAWMAKYQTRACGIHHGFWLYKTALVVKFRLAAHLFRSTHLFPSEPKTVKMKSIALSSSFVLTLAFVPSLAFYAASPDAGEWKAPREGDGTLFSKFGYHEIF